ncbi:hypothetical protein TDB9533_04377 [Thalassocella blandensis]|nr:hypothetical protein TDB9533_04377 [Thalassocella blandensis]
MFTQEEYYWAWGVYLGAFVVCLFAWWMLSANIKWRAVRHISRIVLAVFFIFPWFTEQGSDYLSPAWLVSGIEGAFEGKDAFWRAGKPLLLTSLVTLVLTSLLYTLLWWRGSQPQERQEPTFTGELD